MNSLRMVQIVLLFASIGPLVEAKPPKDEIPGGISQQEKDAGIEQLRYEGYNKDLENFDSANIELSPAKPRVSCYSSFDKTTRRYGVSKSPEAVEDSGFIDNHRWLYRRSYTGAVLDVNYCMSGTNQLIYYSFSVCDVNRTVLEVYQPAYTTYGCEFITASDDWELTCIYFKNGLNEDCISSKISSRNPIGNLVDDDKYLKIELLSSIITRTSICIYIKPTLTKELTDWEKRLEEWLGPAPISEEGETFGCDLYYYFSAITGSVFTILFFCLIVPIPEQEVEFRYQNRKKEKKVAEKEKQTAELDYSITWEKPEEAEEEAEEEVVAVVPGVEEEGEQSIDQEAERRRIMALPLTWEEKQRMIRKANRDRKRRVKLAKRMLERQKVLEEDHTDALFIA